MVYCLSVIFDSLKLDGSVAHKIPLRNRRRFLKFVSIQLPLPNIPVADVVLSDFVCSKEAVPSDAKFDDKDHDDEYYDEVNSFVYVIFLDVVVHVVARIWTQMHGNVIIKLKFLG